MKSKWSDSMGELSAVSTITKVNNLSLSKRLTDHLGWLPNDQVLEKTSNEKIVLTNLTLDDWKDGEVEFNNWLYYQASHYKGKHIFLLHYDQPGYGWYAHSNFISKIANFNKQFKGRFEQGQIAPAGILHKGYYGESDVEISNELNRFYNVRDVDSLVFFNFGLLESRKSEIIEEASNDFLALSCGSEDSAKVVLYGVIQDYKVFEKVLNKFKIQDCLFINIKDKTYFELIEGKKQNVEAIQYNR